VNAYNRNQGTKAGNKDAMAGSRVADVERLASQIPSRWPNPRARPIYARIAFDYSTTQGEITSSAGVGTGKVISIDNGMDFIQKNRPTWFGDNVLYYVEKSYFGKYRIVQSLGPQTGTNAVYLIATAASGASGSTCLKLAAAGAGITAITTTINGTATNNYLPFNRALINAFIATAQPAVGKYWRWKYGTYAGLFVVPDCFAKPFSAKSFTNPGGTINKSCDLGEMVHVRIDGVAQTANQDATWFSLEGVVSYDGSITTGTLSGTWTRHNSASNYGTGYLSATSTTGVYAISFGGGGFPLSGPGGSITLTLTLSNGISQFAMTSSGGVVTGLIGTITITGGDPP